MTTAIPTMKPVIQARGLTKLYGTGSNEIRALSDVDLEIRSGQLFAFR